MDELESNQSSPSNQDCNSSFQSLRLSGSSPKISHLEQDNFDSIEEVPNFQLVHEKSLGQSVRQTYEMCCSGIKTMKTNLAYNLRYSPLEIFTKRQKIVLNKSQPVILLGQTYQDTGKDKQKFYMDFNNVIWLTYRSGIYGVESDAGWGCMIRVCQMLLAQTFKRILPKKPLNQIIAHFRDTPQAYFSLTRICQKGEINKRWTSSIQIFTLLKSFLQKFQEIPLSIDIHCSCIEITSMKQLNSVQYPMMVFVSNRLGKFKIEDDYKEHLLDVMKILYFVGAVGGNGGEALYLIGHYASKVIFMDPHYVQSYQEEDKEKNTSTYFQNQPYSLDVQSLSPSLAISFLVKSKIQYEDLLEKLYQLQIKHEPWFCFQIVSEQIKKRAKFQSPKEDIFEIML